jgi:hypothetical protein
VDKVSQGEGDCAAAHAGADNAPDQAVRLEKEEPPDDRQYDHHHPLVPGEMSTSTVEKSGGRH